MIKFAGITFKGLKKEDVLNEYPGPKFMTTLNAEIIVRANEDREFKKIIDSSICTFDGQVPYWLAKLKNPGHDFEKISGSDFIYEACSFAQEKKKSLFLLGGKSHSNAAAIVRLKMKYPHLMIDGFSPPMSAYPFSMDQSEAIKEKIRLFSPKILFVGFGAVKQERWIYDHLDFLNAVGVELVVGSGGTFEFVSGDLRRAPVLVQRMGLEGLFRFLMEPKLFRFKRLLISLKIFLYFNR